jgi:hypothetical protein
MRAACTGALAILALCVPSASSKTWLVFEDGSGDAPTIQAAFDFSAVGDSIVVGPGTYRGYIQARGGRVLLGRDGAGTTILDADGKSSCLYSMPSDFDFLIEGFKLMGAEPGYGYSGTSVLGFSGPGTAEVRACIFEGSDECGAVSTSAETRIMAKSVMEAESFSPPIPGGPLFSSRTASLRTTLLRITMEKRRLWRSFRTDLP